MTYFKMLPPEKKIEHLSHWGTFLSSIFTLVAVLVAVWTFNRTMGLQKTVTSMSIYNEYLKQVSSKPNYVNIGYIKKLRQDTADYQQYYQFAEFALFTCESLYALDQSPEMKRTIEFILRPHMSRFSLKDVEVESYNADFIKFIQELQNRVAPNKALHRRG